MLWNHDPYMGIIIFPRIDNTKSSGHNELKKKNNKKEKKVKKKIP